MSGSAITRSPCHPDDVAEGASLGARGGSEGEADAGDGDDRKVMEIASQTMAQPRATRSRGRRPGRGWHGCGGSAGSAGTKEMSAARSHSARRALAGLAGAANGAVLCGAMRVGELGALNALAPMAAASPPSPTRQATVGRATTYRRSWGRGALIPRAPDPSRRL